MMKSLRFVLVAALLGLVAVPSFAVTVGGIAWMRASYNRYYYPGAGQKVKFCVDDSTGSGARGEGECYTTSTASNSTYLISVPGNRVYWVFSWNDPYYWGSTTTPAWMNSSSPATRILVGAYNIGLADIYSEPRPFPSSAVYPANGAQNVPLVFTLKWTNGLDAGRIWPGVWSTTYDIYAYGEGGSELKVLADIPCNPDASGNCTYYINNVVPNWLYFWRVVAKLRVTPLDRVFEQSSPTFTFRTQP